MRLSSNLLLPLIGCCLLIIPGCSPEYPFQVAEPAGSDLPQPQLIAPYNSMDDNRLTVTFRWEAVPGADYYHIQIAQDEGFDLLLREDTGISGCCFGQTGLDSYATYYWRVKAHAGPSQSPWSDTWTFSTNDGSGTGTLEGTWKYDRIEVTFVEQPEGAGYMLNGKGSLFLTFSADSYNAEGRMTFTETWASQGTMIQTEEEIDLAVQGCYAIIGDSVALDPVYNIHPDLIGWTDMFHAELQADSLFLTRRIRQETGYAIETSYYLRY